MLCYATLCYALQCIAMLCYALQCIAMLCYAMQLMLCYAEEREDEPKCYAMPRYAMLCNALQCYAMLCNALQCYAMLCSLCYATLRNARTSQKNPPGPRGGTRQGHRRGTRALGEPPRNPSSAEPAEYDESRGTLPGNPSNPPTCDQPITNPFAQNK